MGLKDYFSSLLSKVEASAEITNAGKNEDGFYKPTRTVLIRHLNLLRDLHDKPMARQMVKDAWQEVVKELPPEWLIMNEQDKQDLKKILKD